MIQLILILTGFTVTDAGGNPIPGAWIGSSGSWLGATDQAGVFQVPEDFPDTVTVHATGFSDWTGPLPGPSDTIVLQPEAVGSGTIYVTASRGSLESLMPSTEVLNGKDLEELSSGGLNRLNGRVSGVTVREYGGAIPITSVSLRGGDPGQSEYMVDGISITSPRDGMPTGVFDPVLFSALELARGGAIPGAGSSGSSGALNYLPPLSSEPLYLRTSVNSAGSVCTAARYAGSSISLRRNMGNNGSEGYSGSFLTTHTLGYGFKGGLLAGLSAGETEAPDWTVQGDGERSQGQAEGWLNWHSGNLEADLSAGTGRMIYTQTLPFVIDDTHTDHTERASFVWRGPVNAQFSWISAHLESTASGNHHRNRTGIQITGKVGPFIGWAGYACERGIQARAAVEYGPFRSSVFTDVREPTMNDLYWPSDGMAAGNPDLESERSSGAEAALELTGDLWRCQVTGFVSGTRNLILWLPDAQGVWTPSNLSKALSRGIETSGEVQLSPLSLSGSFTWNLATDETPNTPRNGMLIPYRPEYTWGAAISLILPEEFVFSGDAGGMGKRFTNRTQSEYLDSYTVFNACLRKPVTENVTAEINCLNITDRSYQVTNGYSGMKRTFGFSLTYNGE
ncbi:hypothetical protein CSA37_08420 [Candidatus Fermentibacteria bacterium]|nr:MAG: hypothetical protein CSA37_08420 [Candidatus Fermentibacteria bacterium]